MVSNPNPTATVGVSVSDFTGSFAYINGRRSISISSDALLQHAVSAGVQFASRQPIPITVYKAMAVSASVQFSSGQLRRTSYFPQLVPSEKSNLSYWVGMTFAQVLAEQLLGVSCLIHVQSLIANRTIKPSMFSNRQPDLAGLDTASVWHVIEAKGRSNPPSRADRASWKQQAGAVTFNGGIAPGTQSYSLAILGQPYRLELADPPPDDEQMTTDLEIHQGNLVEAYYAPYSDWLRENSTEVQLEGSTYIAKMAAYSAIDGKFIFIGVASDILNPTELQPTVARQAVDTEHAYVGPNGVGIFKSVSPDSIQLDRG